MDSRAGRRAALHGRDAAPPHAGGDWGGLRPGYRPGTCSAHSMECPGTPRSGAARCGAVRSMKLLVGIDPGVNTGVAVWDRGAKAFSSLTTESIVSAMGRVLALHKAGGGELWFEDARLRTWYGTKGREALQGAGSIKRDCSVWEEYCCLHGIKYRAIRPAKGATKWDAETFRRVTGWDGRTSEHARDAAIDRKSTRLNSSHHSISYAV